VRRITIAPPTEGKGRSFSATLLASVEADLLWPGGHTAGETIRPVWAMFAGSDQEMKAFVANLTMGRKATMPRDGYYRRGKEERMEFLKSARYQQFAQRMPEGTVVTVYLQDLFQIDPGMVDPDGIRFILLPTQEWDSEQKIDHRPLYEHVVQCGYSLTEEFIADLAPTSYLFAAYVDRRTRCPLVADPKFYMQLMLACLQNGLATFAAPRDAYYNDKLGFGVHQNKMYVEYETSDVGLRPGIAFNSDHMQFEELLAEQAALFLA
jgi:hypothetical protein